jgi:hypothetical protein
MGSNQTKRISKKLFKFSFFYRNLSVPCGWSGDTTAAAGHFVSL